MTEHRFTIQEIEFIQEYNTLLSLAQNAEYLSAPDAVTKRLAATKYWENNPQFHLVYRKNQQEIQQFNK